MGCNCGGGVRPYGPSSSKPNGNAPRPEKKDAYVLRVNGGMQVFGSRLEAEAERKRSGGGTIIKRSI